MLQGERGTMRFSGTTKVLANTACWSTVESWSVKGLALDEGHAALLLQALHDGWEGKDERLAGPCEGHADHVSARQNDRQPLDLDGRRPLDALALKLLQNGGRELHLLECQDGRWQVVALCDDVELMPHTLMVII